MPGHEVVVGVVAVDAVPPVCRTWLAPTERERLHEYVSAAEAGRFLAGVSLVRAMVGDALGLEPDLVRLERRCPDCDRPHGAVTVPDGEVSVSVSHSGAHAVVAVSRTGRVGLDHESGAPSDFADLRDWVLPPDDPADLTSASAFLGEWTRREAVLKLFGVGLRVPMTRIRLSPSDAHGGRTASLDPFGACVVMDLDLRLPGATALALARPTQAFSMLDPNVDGDWSAIRRELPSAQLWSTQGQPGAG